MHRQTCAEGFRCHEQTNASARKQHACMTNRLVHIKVQAAPQIGQNFYHYHGKKGMTNMRLGCR